MGDDQYELGVLLQLRERARDEAQDDLAAQTAELARRQKVLEEARGALEAAIEERHDQRRRFNDKLSQGGVSLGSMQMFEDYVRGLVQREGELEGAIRDREGEVSAQREAIAAAQRSLNEAITQLKAVESHKKGWQEERDSEARRKESAAMDEIAARRWRERHGG